MTSTTSTSAHRELALDDVSLGRAAAHYLLHANVHPGHFRARLAAHLADPEFVTDVAVYLIDPATAGDPQALVNHWIRWTDRYLDLAFAQIAQEVAPSKRKERTIKEIEDRLDTGVEQCPVHEDDGSGWRRCASPLDSGGRCWEHSESG